jgi:hypothetical protein
MITEEQLIDLGFEHNHVSPEESGDNEFYYYTLDFLSPNLSVELTLISNASDEAQDGWDVRFLEAESYVFEDYELLKSQVEILNKIGPKN